MAFKTAIRLDDDVDRLYTAVKLYLTQISRAGIENLIDELDLLTVRTGDPAAPPTPEAEIP